MKTPTPWQPADAVTEFAWETPATFNFGTDIVDRQACTDDREALIHEDADGAQRRFLYSDMGRLTDRLGAALRMRGVEKGDRVIVVLPRSPEWMIAMVGALKIGAVPVPCIEMLTARDLAYRCENSQARAIICGARSTSKFDGIDNMASVRFAVGGAVGWVDFDRALDEAPTTLDPAIVAAEDPAVIYYTSGSTGHPKGVVHSARALHAWRVSAGHWLDLAPGDRMWCTADTGWSKAGTSILFGPWMCGATTFLYDGPFDPAQRLALIARHRINVYCAPATELHLVAGEAFGDHDLTALRRTVSAGEAVNRGIAARWHAAAGMRIDEAYGQTEALILAINMPGDEVRPGSMGRPSPGCDLAVIDADGQRLPAGEAGDLALLTPNPQLMLGYWREGERTQACFRDGREGRWYVTGDLAMADEDGYLWFRGRSDDVINSAGYRIGPLEVEGVILEHPAVARCAVVGSPDAQRGEIVTAFIVLRPEHAPGDDALKREIQSHAKALTAPYKYPRRIEFIDALPLGPTGKVQHRALRERARQI